MGLRAKVLTVSDRSSSGERPDLAGPALRDRLREVGYEIVEMRIVADGLESVAAALREMAHEFVGLIVTTGGTGFSPRDLTPEATLMVLDREAPGFGELMRKTHPLGPLSRSRAGTAGATLIVNTPGSPTGAIECLDSLIDLLPHALAVLHNEHHHPPETGGKTATSSSAPTNASSAVDSPFNHT